MGTSGKTGPARAWYILPGLMVLAAIVMAGFGISSFARFVSSDFRAYQPGSSISVAADGFTVYAEGLNARDADLRCTAIGPGRPVQLQPVSGRTTFSNRDGTFTAIASTPRRMPAGSYMVSCVSEVTGNDLQLYVGPRVDLAGVGFSAIVLFTILAVLRYRAHRRSVATA